MAKTILMHIHWNEITVDNASFRLINLPHINHKEEFKKKENLELSLIPKINKYNPPTTLNGAQNWEKMTVYI